MMQGEVTGPGQCSNQIDTFGKECIEEEEELLYTYKHIGGIPPLGMVWYECLPKPEDQHEETPVWA